MKACLRETRPRETRFWTWRHGCLMMPQTAAAQGPIVVLEYPGYASDSTPGLNQDNAFVYDPDHTASHRVQPDETLSHIITAYYAEAVLTCRSCRWRS